MSPRQLVIWNSHAGSVAAATDIHQQLRANHRSLVYEPKDPADAVQTVSQAVEEGVRHFLAAGGDGTVNSVINGLRNAPADTVLGVLPLGTANDWCRSLGIPNDLQVAWEIIKRGDLREIDLIEIETQAERMLFANIATGGNSYRVTEAMTDELKQRWGALCYIRGAIDVLTDLDSFKAKISLDNQPAIEMAVWNILVANGRTSAGSLNVAPRASLTDGLLDVVVIEEGTMLDLADLTTRYLFDEYISSDKVFYRQAKEIRIESTPPLYFSIDGDLIEHQPVCFRVLPKALRVIVGEEFNNLQIAPAN